MIWKTVYLAVFAGGLALAVHTMLHGAERWRRQRSAKPSPMFNPPTVAALAAGFGSGGYLFYTRTGLEPVIVLLLAACVGIAAYSGMSILMAKWALRHPAGPGEGEEINGQVATVTSSIGEYESGEITYLAWNQRRTLPARAVDGSEIAVGTEVVIDTVENGVAQVELWSVVEQRL